MRRAADDLLALGAADDLDEARLEAELLLAEAAGWERAQLLARGAEQPSPEVQSRFEALLERRRAREPLAYILGRREFYGLTFEVGPGALIPRPATETLVEATLAAVREHRRARRLVRVADVGTGPGTVALAVARHAPNAKVWATEPSTAALALAGRNRERFELRDRIVLLAGELIESLPGPVDVLSANLPYIPSAEVDRLPPEIRDWEPRKALDGGADGLDVIRALVASLEGQLAEDAWAVLLEVGEGQAAEVTQLLEAATGGTARVHRDLGGVERVVEARAGY